MPSGNLKLKPLNVVLLLKYCPSQKDGLLWYENTKKAITDHVDELDQKMLSYDECKELFESYENTRVFEKTESFSGWQNVTPKNPIKVNPFGMKLINE